MNGDVFVLDTNMLVAACSHRNPTVWNAAKQNFDVENPQTTLLICIVSVAEFRSFAEQSNWSARKLKDLDSLLHRPATIDINREEVLSTYVEIDVFSKRDPRGAVNMGKNDIWIAAVAKAAGIPLLTTDTDFDHLHGKLLTRHFIDPKTGAISTP